MIDDGLSSASHRQWRLAMKILVSTLIALSVLAVIAAPAAAFDASSFYQELDRRSGGTAN
jgi:hypothetical protein